MTDESELIQEVRRTNELLSALVKIQLRDVLESELADKKKKRLYELTGGSLAVKEISKKVGMATGPISQTWQGWERLGLLIKEGKKYRRVL